MKDIMTGLVALALYIIIIGILIALPVMFLWNWVMPDIFGLPLLDFWHALGLSLLSSCLFNWGGLKGRGK